ncbi:hypothetical protein [Neobacillus sp. YIM B06451]|uniref:hypothetical protein n=1 Tax=Neobacillus sp. YIM B06451 TaxID=3070994 RepID=UPI00292D1ACE|nr:hypothetical protein [Neobacillus sp. YIM B06451]
MEEKQVTLTDKMKEVFRNIPVLRSEDILRVSGRYVAFLERLVLEFEKKFAEEGDSGFTEGFSMSFTNPDLFK